MTAQATLIDGKYQVVRELSREGHVTLSEVLAAEGGVTRRVAWFDVASPAARQGFHTYRAALRAADPAGLTDVVARPGAYYAVWQPVTGTPLEEVAAQPVKQEETVEALQALAARLAEHGYALPDADVLVDGREVRVAYLRPAPEGRTPEEVVRLNAQALAPFVGGRVRRRRQPGVWLTFVPGLLFLGGAGYLGAQASQIYLNPPVREVVGVIGKPARDAAQRLVSGGFRVEYTMGEASGVPIGSVIRQEPAAGTNLPAGRLVTLTVNNPPSLAVPRLEELTVDQARAALRDVSLTLDKTVLTVDGSLTKTPKGRIIAQVPESGSTTQRGQPVQVIVSSGVRSKETFLADLTGLNYEAAREHVRVAGLVVTRVVQQPSDAPENTVIEQKPAAYARVPVGGPVVLTVAVARYTPPSQPAGSLPLPPPPVPVVPEEPATEEPQQGTPTNVEQTEPTQNGESQAQEPQTSPEESTEQSSAGPDEGGQSATEPAQQPEAPTDPPGEEATSQAPDTSSTGTSTDVEPPATPPASDAAPRTISLRYQFPADLPEGTYSIFVRDADGEREVRGNLSSADLAGNIAEGEETARGDATFIIRRDGEDYATVQP